MKRVAIVADTHADEHSRFEEHNRIMSWVAHDIADRGVDLVVHGGDLWERRSTSAERKAVADWVTAVTEHAGLVVVAGNHDDPSDVMALGRLRTRHRVYAFDRPGVVSVAGIGVAALPWPRKANLLAMAGDRGHAETDAIAIDLLRDVMRGLGATLDGLSAVNPNMPRVLATHVMIDGARTDHEQPIVGADMAVSLADLSLARAHLVACGHIHAQNDWRFGGSEILYPGTPRCSNFGEPGPKGYVIAELDGVGAKWTRIPTPATPMLLIEARWNAETASLDITSKTFPRADNCAGAEVRIRYETASDTREAAKDAAREMRDRMIEWGALHVKPDEQVIPTSRARSPEISTAKTTRDKVECLWRVRNDVPSDDRAERLFAKLNELEAA